MKLFLRVTLVLLAVAVLSTAAFAGFAVSRYEDRVLPNTRLAGESVAGLTRQQLFQRAQEIGAEYSQHQFTIVLDNEDAPAETTVTAADLGVTFAVEAAAQKVWDKGRSGSLFSRVSQVAQSYWAGSTTSITYSVNAESLDSGIARLIDPLIVQPTPAKIQVKDGVISIADAIPGKKVEASTLKQKLSPALALSNEKTPTAVRVETVPTESTITRTTLEPLVAQLQSLSAQSLTLQSNASRLIPSREELLRWYGVVQDESGNVAIAVDAAAVASYLKANTESVDIDKSVPVVTTALQSQSVKAANAARLPTTTLALVAMQKTNTAATAGTEYQLGLYEGKYIQVSLKEQKLYAIEGSTLVKTYTVSTGKWSTPTPKGTFTVTSKYPRAYSRSFGLYMPYWMNFIGKDENGKELPLGSYGFHELPEWPNGYKEGQAHLGTAVSHGCVRLGVGDAAEMYAWTPVGTPVMIR